ncbi:hypothetical protein, partial [Klebsiella pneumoniae]|uniref:hypothetical protein n=3 Tax=Enterobacterales TaxID=91347 RepID=UPI001CE49FE0
NDVTLKMPAFEWVHVQLHQQKGMISLSPPTICNSAVISVPKQSCEYVSFDLMSHKNSFSPTIIFLLPFFGMLISIFT